MKHILLVLALILLVGCKAADESTNNGTPKEIRELEHKFNLYTNGDNTTVTIPGRGYNTYATMELKCVYGVSSIKMKIWHTTNVDIANFASTASVNYAGENIIFTRSTTNPFELYHTTNARYYIEHMMDVDKDNVGVTLFYRSPGVIYSLLNIPMDGKGLQQLIDSLPTNSCQW